MKKGGGFMGFFIGFIIGWLAALMNKNNRLKRP